MTLTLWGSIEKNNTHLLAANVELIYFLWEYILQLILFQNQNLKKITSFICIAT